MKRKQMDAMIGVDCDEQLQSFYFYVSKIQLFSVYLNKNEHMLNTVRV